MDDGKEVMARRLANYLNSPHANNPHWLSAREILRELGYTWTRDRAVTLAVCLGERGVLMDAGTLDRPSLWRFSKRKFPLAKKEY